MQKTRPKKGKPVEIPIPTRKEVLDLMRKVVRSDPPDDGSKSRRR